MLDFIKNVNYRYAYIKVHGVPVFADRYRLANKSLYSLKGTEELYRYVDKETQRGKEVLFHKNFYRFNRMKRNYKHKGDLGFNKDGLYVGDVFEVGNRGYMENVSVYMKIILLTDKYVYGRNIEDGFLGIYSYEEVKRMIKSDSSRKLEKSSWSY